MLSAIWQWALYILAIATVAVQIYRWYRTSVLFGGIPKRTVYHMLRFACKTPKVFMLYGAALGAILVILGLMLLPSESKISLPTPVAAIILASFMTTFLWNVLPPTVLLLTNSSAHTAELLHRINSGIKPLRAVALLDFRRAHFIKRWDIRDNLRTSDGKLWKSIVHKLIAMTPIVAIDARPKSGPVALETFLMLAPERIGKAIFIVGSNNECPSLMAHGINPAVHALRTVKEEELVRELQELTRSQHTLPLAGRSAESLSDEDIVSENWDSLPSVIVLPLSESFDSQEIVDIANLSNKQIFCLTLPGKEIEKEASIKLIDYYWEFAFDPRLVAMSLRHSGQILIRTSFLRNYRDKIGKYSAIFPKGRLTWQMLVQPHPVLQAVHEFFEDLAKQANQYNLMVRYVDA